MRAVSGRRGRACVALAHSLLLGRREAPLRHPQGPVCPAAPCPPTPQGAHVHSHQGGALSRGSEWRQLPVPRPLTSQHASPQDVNPGVPEAPNPVERSAWQGLGQRE